MTVKAPYEKLAEIYDAIFPDRYYQEYYTFILTILGRLRLNPKSVLDLACGTGKLAKIFLDHGYAVEGLDLSSNMLDVAKQKGLTVHQGNMITFELKKTYDLILCIFDSLNYIQQQADLQRCFNTVYRHLTHDGLFIFDMNSVYKINMVIPNVKISYHRVGDIESIWINSHQADTWISDMIFFEKTPDGTYARFTEKHVEKAYKLSTVKTLLKKAHFKLVESYADFHFDKIRRNSIRWIFVCQHSKCKTIRYATGKLPWNTTARKTSFMSSNC